MRAFEPPCAVHRSEQQGAQPRRLGADDLARDMPGDADPPPAPASRGFVRRGGELLPIFRWSFPRRRQYRRLRRAVASGVAALAARAAAVNAADTGAMRVADMLLLVMVGLLSRSVC